MWDPAEIQAVLDALDALTDGVGKLIELLRIGVWFFVFYVGVWLYRILVKGKFKLEGR